MLDTAAVSPHHFENGIREKFLGHVCETCQRILISADKGFFSFLCMDTTPYQDFFFFFF